MDTKMDELSILKYLHKLQENGEVGETFVHLVSNKDINVYVAAPTNNLIGTIVKIESALYIKRELNVMSVTRKNNTIKALLNNEITVFIKVITPNEADELKNKSNNGKDS